MRVNEIGQNGCNLVKKWSEDPRTNDVNIYGKISPPITDIIIMCAFKGTQVKFFTSHDYFIRSSVAKYLAEGLTASNITSLTVTQNPIGIEEWNL